MEQGSIFKERVLKHKRIDHFYMSLLIEKACTYHATLVTITQPLGYRYKSVEMRQAV